MQWFNKSHHTFQKPDPMLLPVYDEDGATFSLFRLKVAMDLYDLLAGVNNTPAANKVLSKEEVLERQPNLKKRRFGRRWGLP